MFKLTWTRRTVDILGYETTRTFTFNTAPLTMAVIAVLLANSFASLSFWQNAGVATLAAFWTSDS